MLTTLSILWYFDISSFLFPIKEVIINFDSIFLKYTLKLQYFINDKGK